MITFYLYLKDDDITYRFFHEIRVKLPWVEIGL